MDQSKKIGIVYSELFDEFLLSLNNEQRAETIKQEIEKFADGIINLDVKECKFFENRDKVGILNANVIVFYDIKGNDWILISGLPGETRVA